MDNTGFGGIKFDLPKNQSNVIKVIGVGGGGSNAINHMFQQGIKGVDFIICNTDSQALENSSVPNKIQLGVNLTEGLGAGANPEVGQQSALESIDDIEKMLDINTKMVFITAGMGGGTGTGAAPVIAQLSKERDILTVGIVTIPFQFEGKVRIDQALKGVERLRKNVDSLVVINNNKLREVYGNLGFKAGFSKADEVLSTAARGIAEVITHHYTQNIDLKDAKTVLSDSGTAIMGSASASGETRAKDAIIDALDSPLLNDNKITGAKNVLLLIVSGTSEITIDEIGEINDHIQTEAGHNANIIMGVGEDESLGEAVSVTIIATGFNFEQQKTIVAAGEPKMIIHTLEDEQRVVRDLSSSSNNSFSYATPDQPLSNSVLLEEEIGASNEITIFELEDNFDEGIEEEDLNKSTLESISDQQIETANNFSFSRQQNTGLDDFFEIVSPQAVQATPLVDSTSVDKSANKSSDLREGIVNDSQNLKPTPSTDQKTNMTASAIVQATQRIVYDLEPALQEQERHQGHSHNVASGITSIQEEKIYFSLDDYTQKEQELAQAEQKEDNDFKVVVKEVESAPLVETIVEDLSDEVNPLEMSIEEFSLRSRTAERRKKMKDFNYKFNSSTAENNQYKELDAQPAYKRMGVNLDEAKDAGTHSRTSVSLDDNNENKLRSNNSFLHDNVD